MKLSDDKLKKYAKRAAARRPRGNCPEDEALAAFAQGELAQAEADVIFAHICRCPLCLESVRAVRCILEEGEQEARARVPLSFLERARKLDPASSGAMDVAIRFAKGAAEVLWMSGEVTKDPVPAAEHVRGEGQVVSENLVTFSKPFPPYLAEVEVERTRPDRGEISMKLTHKSGQPAKGVRVSLFSGDQELESAMLESGFAVFESLKFGQYRLEITRVGEPIGRVTLEMKGEGK